MEQGDEWQKDLSLARAQHGQRPSNHPRGESARGDLGVEQGHGANGEHGDGPKEGAADNGLPLPYAEGDLGGDKGEDDVDDDLDCEK